LEQRQAVRDMPVVQQTGPWLIMPPKCGAFPFVPRPAAARMPTASGVRLWTAAVGGDGTAANCTM